MGIGRLGVVGAGVMGSEIAFVAAAAGLEVMLADADPDRLEAGVGHVAGLARRRVERGRLAQDAADALIARVRPAAGTGDLSGCDAAVEAVTERMEVKRAVLADLDRALPAGALIATNTSGLSITALGRATGRPGRVLGLHFFNPASVMRLVEVIAGDQTTPETIEEGRALAVALGKTPVLVRECAGFLVNRVVLRGMAAAYRAVAAGADPARVDAAVVAGGPAPMGPHALADLIGIDVMDMVMRDLRAAYGDRYDDAGRLGALLAAGRLGRKTGGGFFAAPPPEAVPDDAARAAAAAFYAAVADEARRCVAEGVATAPDVETAVMLGAGWSAGPLT
ncbi:MAG: 3-hydroxyacyl-CoA dehydrogenase [Thermoleophilia bacterium]|jgi:3-hydroxybutyryl-CoA dehydrogenase|nr:3-hydroxyacyl-CoA dehydrogenase [Thermoleophilia bacterium]